MWLPNRNCTNRSAASRWLSGVRRHAATSGVRRHAATQWSGSKIVAGAGLSREELRTWIEPNHNTISIAWQCELLGLPRSSRYYEPCGETPENLALIRRIDELYTEWPLLGSRKLALEPGVNRKRVGVELPLALCRAKEHRRNLLVPPTSQ